MSDSMPATVAGFSTSCTPEQISARQLGMVLWYYQADGVTPNTPEQRLNILRASIALRKANYGKDTPATPEAMDAVLLHLWNGFPAESCQA